MKIKSLARVLNDAPSGRWIALSRDRKRILGHGRTIATAVRQALKAGEPYPLIVKSPARRTGLSSQS